MFTFPKNDSTYVGPISNTLLLMTALKSIQRFKVKLWGVSWKERCKAGQTSLLVLVHVILLFVVFCPLLSGNVPKYRRHVTSVSEIVHPPLKWWLKPI